MCSTRVFAISSTCCRRHDLEAYRLRFGGAFDRKQTTIEELNQLGRGVGILWGLVNRGGNREDLNRAIHDYTRAIQLDPNLGVSYHGRALIYAFQGNKQAAQDDARRALQLGISLDPMLSEGLRHL
jgi:tetratricopeptide (TPR) repeat protein